MEYKQYICDSEATHGFGVDHTDGNIERSVDCYLFPDGIIGIALKSSGLFAEPSITLMRLTPVALELLQHVLSELPKIKDFPLEDETLSTTE